MLTLSRRWFRGSQREFLGLILFKDDIMKLNIAAILMLSVCSLTPVSAKAADKQATDTASNVTSTCTGAYPSYFQDPAFNKTGMWDNQVIINQAYSGWTRYQYLR